MNTRITTILFLVMIVAASLTGFLLWDRLPAQMASHWNINDQVDGYTSKLWGVLLMPLIATGLFLLFLVIPNIDPLKQNILQFRNSFNLFILLITVFLLYIYGLTLAWNLGNQDFSMGRAMLPGLGILFMYIGYLLRQSKRNFFIGIRTPWTLSSDRVWEKTHQLGGILFMIAGVIALIGSFFGGTTAFWLFFVPLMGSVIILTAYSYLIYRQEAGA